MSSSDIAISVRNLTKTYRLFGHPGSNSRLHTRAGLWVATDSGRKLRR